MSIFSFISMQRQQCAQGITRLKFEEEWGEASIRLGCIPRSSAVCQMDFSGYVLRQKGRLDSMAQTLFPAREACTHCCSKSTKQTWQKLVGTWTSNTEMKGCIVYSWSHKLLTPTWFVPLDSHCKIFSFLWSFPFTLSNCLCRTEF